MRLPYVSVVLSILAATSTAAPGGKLSNRQCGGLSQATIPQVDPNPIARASAITTKREGYLYAPSLIGNASYHLGGTLGKARVQSDLASWFVDRNRINASLEADLVVLGGAITANQGLRSLDDYTNILYEGQWRSSVPRGEAPGMLSNYTQDLLFSMERLSINPFPLRCLKITDSLPFLLPLGISLRIADLPLVALRLTGRLFVVDHSYQARYEKNSRYGAFCTAYFFIHPKSGDFLPLAIKTNTGADLVYTPLDTPDDWLLTKMMFSANDLFHSQIYHLAASHDIGEPVHEAALRTLSDNHPVFLILERLMTQEYALQVVGNASLFNIGGNFDKLFHSSSNGARQYVTETYPVDGAYIGGYLENNLKSRGLLDPLIGPNFKSFHFYNDALPLRNTIKAFFASFVNSYYATDFVAYADKELQAWFIEANTAAKVIDFPQCGHLHKPCGKKVLIEVLSHFAYLSGVAHHALNTGSPAATLATLPFHPAAFYAPLPTTKGVTNLLPFLPPPPQAITHIVTFAFFNRAYFEEQNRTLAYAFSDEALLGRLNLQTRTAAIVFQAAMKDISTQVRARVFDAKGLSMGMPFIWKGLDPGTVPFFFAV